MVHNGSSRCTYSLLVLDEIIRKPSKEFEAACCPVVCMNHLVEKLVGIELDNAKDAEGKPLCPVLGGEIAVHLQLIHTILLFMSMVPACQQCCQ